MLGVNFGARNKVKVREPPGAQQGGIGPKQGGILKNNSFRLFFISDPL